MITAIHSRKLSCRGFTLMELAMVLMIVGLLLGGLLVPLSAQNDFRYVSETQKTLGDIRDALIGFAAANGRLPCPAAPNTTGVESPSTGSGICTNPWDGFAPGITLGVAPTDQTGYVIDAWGNRIHYAVTNWNSNTFTVPPTITAGMKGVGLAGLTPDLQVCSSGSAVTGAGTPSANCSSASQLVKNAVAVIYSTGKNTGSGGAGPDEQHNPNPNTTVAADKVFVSASPSANFDDIMIWLSPNTLYNRMITAGQLP